MAKIQLLFSILYTLLCICLGKLDLRNVISYKASNYSYYQPWNLRGEFTFIFKTTQQNGLLVYQDDGKHSFMEVFLVDGSVRFKACLGSCDNHIEIFIQENFSDGFWHKLRIIRKSKNCTISVDDSILRFPCAGSMDQRFKYYDNFLYIANFNPVVSLNNFVFPGAFHEGLYYRFQGCIGDVKFTNYKGKLVDATLKQTTGERGCESACAVSNVNKCQNKGKCVDDIGHVICDCTATGYDGLLCSEPSSSLFLNGSGYILYDVGVYHPGRSTVGNTIAFRFATTNPMGVVLLTDIADDHVVVELVNGFLRVSWDLGQGGLVLMSRQGCLNDAVWHSVTINRLQRRVKMTVDDQKPIHAAIPGKFSFLDFKGGREHMLFGGGPLTKAFNRSLSRANFTGFLQQFQFDEFDVIDETISGKSFELIGDGVLNASSLHHVIPASPSPLVNCSREVDPDRERLCDGVDDEDLCGSPAVASGSGPLGPDCEDGGSCATSTDLQLSTERPTIQASPHKNSSFNEMTSLAASQIHPTPSQSHKSTMTSQVSGKAMLLATESGGLSNQNSSFYGNSSGTKQTAPMAESSEGLLNATIRVSNSRITPSSSPYNVTTSNKTNARFTFFESTLAWSMNDTSSTVFTQTSSVDNSTELAYRNDVTKTTGKPTWLVILVIVTILGW